MFLYNALVVVFVRDKSIVWGDCRAKHDFFSISMKTFSAWGKEIVNSILEQNIAFV